MKVGVARGVVIASLAGRGQALETGIGVASLARALVEEHVARTGLWLAEPIVPSELFFNRLAAHEIVLAVEEQFPKPNMTLWAIKLQR